MPVVTLALLPFAWILAYGLCVHDQGWAAADSARVATIRTLGAYLAWLTYWLVSGRDDGVCILGVGLLGLFSVKGDSPRCASADAPFWATWPVPAWVLMSALFGLYVRLLARVEGPGRPRTPWSLPTRRGLVFSVAYWPLAGLVLWGYWVAAPEVFWWFAGKLTG